MCLIIWGFNLSFLHKSCILKSQSFYIFHWKKKTILSEDALFIFVFSHRLLGKKADPIYHSITGHHPRARVSDEGQGRDMCQAFPPWHLAFP